MSFGPNQVHFGETLHIAGIGGDIGESSSFSVTWVPIRESYSSLDPDPFLLLYKGTAKFNRYDIKITMPAYGLASDGTMKPILARKGRIKVSGTIGNPNNSSVVIQPLPAKKIFLSINGIPAADSLFTPIVVGGRALVPIRAIASLTGEPVMWDAKTRSVLIRTKPAALEETSGSPQLWIDGNRAAAELEPIIRNGTAYAPIRAVTAAFGLPVVWDTNSRSINVTLAP